MSDSTSSGRADFLSCTVGLRPWFDHAQPPTHAHFRQSEEADFIFKK